MARYKQTRTGCSESYAIILDYARAITRYRDSRIDLFTAIKDQLNDLYTTNLLYNNNITVYKSKVYEF